MFFMMSTFGVNSAECNPFLTWSDYWSIIEEQFWGILAMMSCLLIMVVCICYLCHWRFQKTEGRFERRQSWLQVADSETPVHIFTLDQQDRDETLDIPPPTYEEVIENDKACCEDSDPDLPNYETAMKLSGRGYV